MRVLLADARALVREGLRRVTLQIDGTCDFVEAADAGTALAALRHAPPFDAAWFDEALFAPDEIVALRYELPQLLLLALVARFDAPASTRMLGAGINAVVPRTASTDVLGAALRLAMAGNVCIRGNDSEHPRARLKDRIPPGSRRGTGPLNLTARQYDVLGLVAQSRSNKAIAAELGIGLRTVKGHVSVILRALHADNRTDAGRTARRWLARGAPVLPLPGVSA
jgi:DNA-binding NarL/FixJ family response regulator